MYVDVVSDPMSLTIIVRQRKNSEVELKSKVLPFSLLPGGRKADGTSFTVKKL